jgi:type II secretory pathway component PulF
MAYRLLQTYPAIRRATDGLKLGIPVIGSIINRIVLTRFSQAMQILFESGVPILTALALVRGIVMNQVLTEAFDGLTDHIRRGGKIADYMLRSGLFPPLVCQMVASGEASGNLGSMFGEIGRVYQKQTERALKLFVSLLEPALIVVMGLSIGAILIALLLPMFSMVQGFKR